MQIADVRWSSTAEYGRERPAANVRGVRPGAPDQRAPGQNNRRQQRFVVFIPCFILVLKYFKFKIKWSTG